MNTEPNLPFDEEGPFSGAMKGRETDTPSANSGTSEKGKSVQTEEDVKMEENEIAMQNWQHYLELCRKWKSSNVAEQEGVSPEDMQSYVREYLPQASELGTHIQLMTLLPSVPSVSFNKETSTRDLLEGLGREHCKTLLVRALLAVVSKQDDIDLKHAQTETLLTEAGFEGDELDTELELYDQHGDVLEALDDLSQLVSEAETYNQAVYGILGSYKIESNFAKAVTRCLPKSSALWDEAKLSTTEEWDRQQLQRKCDFVKSLPEGFEVPSGHFSGEDARMLDWYNLRQTVAESMKKEASSSVTGRKRPGDGRRRGE